MSGLTPDELRLGQMSGGRTGDPDPARPIAREVRERLERLEKAVDTMAWWLVAAQTGFGEQDAQGISDILASVGETE